MRADYSIENIAELMPSRSASETEKWKQFIKTFFDFLEESLIKNKDVTIKGLGTFRLQKVRTLQSIDQKTGEVKTIPPHYKMVFMSDRDLDNKVGDIFKEIAKEKEKEAARLAMEEEQRLEEERQRQEEEERAKLEANEEMTSQEQEEASQSQETDELSNVDADSTTDAIGKATENEKVDEEKEQVVVPEVKNKVEEEVAESIRNEVFEETIEIKEWKRKKRKLEGSANDFSASSNRVVFRSGGWGGSISNEKSGKKFNLSMIVIPILLILVIALFCWLITSKGKGDSTSSRIEQKPQFYEANVNPVKDGEIEKEVIEDDIVATEQVAEKEVFADKAGDGFMDIVVQNLRSIAKTHYGDEVFWVYIYKENESKISASDETSADLKLDLPVAKKYRIDAQNKQSLMKAYRLERKLLQDLSLKK